MSHHRLDQDAMLVATDHEVRTRAPPVVLVKMPLSLDPLHGRAAFVAGRRGECDQLPSGHGQRGLVEAEYAAAVVRSPGPASAQSVRTKSTRVVLDRNRP